MGCIAFARVIAEVVYPTSMTRPLLFSVSVPPSVIAVAVLGFIAVLVLIAALRARNKNRKNAARRKEEIEAVREQMVLDAANAQITSALYEAEAIATEKLVSQRKSRES